MIDANTPKKIKERTGPDEKPHVPNGALVQKNATEAYRNAMEQGKKVRKKNGNI